MSRLVPAGAAIVFVAVACSAEATNPAETSDGGSEGTAQLRKDLLPVLEAWCATSECHGGGAKTDVGLTLRTNDPAAVHAELTTRQSAIAKGARLVVPGDPDKSFLLAKIEGTQTGFDAACVPPGCGDTMPPGSRLNAQPRAWIRAWIAAGAKDD